MTVLLATIVPTSSTVNFSLSPELAEFSVWLIFAIFFHLVGFLCCKFLWW